MWKVQTRCLKKLTLWHYVTACHLLVTLTKDCAPPFLSVVFASLHTGNINFIMPNDICCLYLTITPSNTCSFNGSQGLTNSEHSSMTSHGFTLFTSSSDLDGACGDLCPRFLRQFHGLKWIGLFRWHGSGLSTLSCISYSWFTGIECSKLGCIVHAQADILHMGACLF